MAGLLAGLLATRQVHLAALPRLVMLSLLVTMLDRALSAVRRA